MKTRIRKKEYNNGKIEYICEKKYTPEIATFFLFVSIGLIYLSLNYFIIKDWSLFAISINGLLATLFISIGSYIKGWTPIYDYKYSVFNNITDAKNLINEVFKKEHDNKVIEYGNKTNKTTIIKFP